jgi:hypothetical protein
MMNEDWNSKPISFGWDRSWTARVTHCIIVTDENVLLDNIEKQFEAAEDQTSIAREMLSAIGVKI